MDEIVGAGVGFVLMAIAAVLLNLALLGGAVWVVVFVLRATGVLH